MKTRFPDHKIYIDFICQNCYWEQFYHEESHKKRNI